MAAAAGVHASSLYRVLRTLASVEIFAEGEHGRFGLTPAAEGVLSAPSSLHPNLFWLRVPHGGKARALNAAITGVSLPHYWVGIVLVAIFAVILNALPAQGMGAGGFPTDWEHIRHLILPVITLSLIPMGVISRLVRANVLEILSHEFVGTLHAKGLLNRRVLYHVMKNAAPSALALMGLQFGYLLGGSILVETVFNWPGSGGLMNLAIFRRDIPVLSATILVLATIFVIINILVDVLQALIDPRMRR